MAFYLPLFCAVDDDGKSVISTILENIARAADFWSTFQAFGNYLVVPRAIAKIPWLTRIMLERNCFCFQMKLGP